MAFSVPLVAAASETEAVRLGYDAMAIGADAIMCQWSPKFVRAAAEAGIPIQGHAGSGAAQEHLDRRASRRRQDHSTRRVWVYREIKALEEAGAYAVEVEVIPEELLIEITKRTTLLTSSIGGGRGGDIQFLFAEDILGNNAPPYPRHSKQYRNIYKMKQEMQAERVAGFREFVEDVQSGRFPAPEHVIKAVGDADRRLPWCHRQGRLSPDSPAAGEKGFQPFPHAGPWTPN